MIAKDGGRTAHAWVVGLTLLGAATTAPAFGQQAPRGKSAASAAKAPAGKATVGKDDAPSVRRDQIEVPPMKETAIPVNPTDAIAIVNDQVISRQQLADECVARKGKEILETLINRSLIEQALKAQKKEVTAAEIDQEIDTVAVRFGIGREAWLRTLDKERGISPFQYARDVIYPALAMRKLCEGRVQVTDEDLKQAFDAQYGDKLRCRLIMVDKLAKAQDIWEALRKNPGGFEKMAQEQSMDLASRSLGGLIGEPITRNFQPANVASSAFSQLLDGDPADKDPAHKPKDGDITGPIQATEGAWLILRREGVIPAMPNVSIKDEAIRKRLQEIVYEVKLKETMGVVFEEMMKKSAIENKLVGTMKMANEEQQPDFRVDDKVKLMSNPESNTPETSGQAAGNGSGSAPTARKSVTPAGVSAEAAAQFEKLKETKKVQTPTAPSPVTPTPGSPR
ncbi:peptidylprolyl isomerase [Paludisphaera mucosa]|uniref:peptidylprolyl isomerase n=1 Tax=Paludisphaera mucosa TaxID=3030827 RepID=A0ABT6F760_9BACT|nr:peptidylprolyl isomerase [Paludisphaera mucosa]MDG3003413.1 peptidylprolyl isomerase [Paludisphaera mucosa]